MPMKTLDVALGERSYPIYIGRGLLDQAELIRRHVAASQVMVVSNETVAPLYLQRPLAMLIYLFAMTVDTYFFYLPGMEMFVPIFFLKLLICHLLRGAPFLPRP